MNQPTALHRLRRPSRLLGLIGALALVAAACGGGSDTESADDVDTTGTTGGASTAPDSDTPDPSTAPTEAPDDGSGGQLDEQVAIATEPWETDWSMATVDIGELMLGIGTVDPRDRIPPIDAPVFESVTDAAAWLAPNEPGVLVSVDGEPRYYALSILTRHEIVNDDFGDVPVAVTYCPLCNTALAFDRRLDGEVLRFGVSGLLRNSDLVMWDDATTSLWQQITGEAIVGAKAGSQLTPLSTSIVSFEDFGANFPEGLSLSRDTGFGIAYGANPYVDYSSRAAPLPFFTGELDTRFPALERVVGVSVDGSDKAYPFSLISEVGAVNDIVNDLPVVVLWGGNTVDALGAAVIADSEAIGTGVAYDPVIEGQTLTFETAGENFLDEETGTTWTLLGRAIDGPLEGTQLETLVHRNEFWFAWTAFFPEATVYGG